MIFRFRRFVYTNLYANDKIVKSKSFDCLFYWHRERQTECQKNESEKFEWTTFLWSMYEFNVLVSSTLNVFRDSYVLYFTHNVHNILSSLNWTELFLSWMKFSFLIVRTCLLCILKREKIQFTEFAWKMWFEDWQICEGIQGSVKDGTINCFPFQLNVSNTFGGYAQS